PALMTEGPETARKKVSLWRSWIPRYLIAVVALMIVMDTYFVSDELKPPEQTGVQNGQVDGSQDLPQEWDPETNARSVAVLSFADHSEENNDLHLADAIHEELLTRLNHIASLKVITHGSVEKYRDSDKPLQLISRELGVASILTGSVQVMGNHLRIQTQLVDAESGEVLWAESYDRELTATNFFTIQSEIAGKVAASLSASLSLEESARLTEIPTENFDAYRVLLLGHVALEKGTIESFHEALGHYQQALTLNPGFLNAHIAIARAYSIASEDRGIPQSEARDQMVEHAQKALSLSPNSSRAHRFLGQVSMEIGEFHEAEVHFNRALELNPGDIHTLHGLGMTLRLIGRAEESVPFYDRAVELDPLSPIINESRASLLRDLGRFEEAEQQYRTTLQIDPEYVFTYWGLGTLFWIMGNPGEAVVWFEKGASLTPQGDVFNAWLALMYLEMQQDDMARAVLDDALNVSPLMVDNDAVLVEELFRIYYSEEVSGLPDGRRFIPRILYGGLTGLPLRELLGGDFAAALEGYEKRYPDISTLKVPVDGGNYQAAIYVAFALDRLGERRRALALLDRAESALKGMQRLGIHGYWVADAQIQVIRRDYTGSIERLETAVEEGWRNLWRFYLFHDPILQGLREQPGFQTLVKHVRDGMVAGSSEKLVSRSSQVP
ncbi:MAG: tetratricopeptide repeat protein, partial [Xanthomonadales bacterium]|nr:tetratricopeptide repeat protein [Xanthomonadales bacterium]